MNSHPSLTLPTVAALPESTEPHKQVLRNGFERRVVAVLNRNGVTLVYYGSCHTWHDDDLESLLVSGPGVGSGKCWLTVERSEDTLVFKHVVVRWKTFEVACSREGIFARRDIG